MFKLVNSGDMDSIIKHVKQLTKDWITAVPPNVFSLITFEKSLSKVRFGFLSRFISFFVEIENIFSLSSLLTLIMN